MSEYTLQFPVEAYTMKQQTVQTAAGEKVVDYRCYEHIPYVTNPVDVEYESLDVWAPVSINGEPVDTAKAPIFFVIGVGGYMSCNNVRPGMPGMPGGPDGPDGGPGGPDGGPSGPVGLVGLGGMGGPEANKYYALAYGFVVVSPGCRGRDNQWPDGTYYGKAPAAIVDLKAAVSYLRHNKGVVPGNPDYIMSSGGSAGGALSSLLASSGNAPEYKPYLKAIGAADEADNIYAAVGFSPIINLENADGAYEFEMGSNPVSGPATGPIHVKPGMVDQELSKELIAEFRTYQDSLGLIGRGDFGVINTDNLGDYIMQYYLQPLADKHLAGLDEAGRAAYLADRPWLSWDGEKAVFTYRDFLKARGRMKGCPAFDDLDKAMAEPILFGTETEDSRHFTTICLRRETGDPASELDADLQQVIYMMNPMNYTANPGCAQHWWLRHGAIEMDTSLPVFVDFVTSLENQGKDVNGRLVWDGGHCADDDIEGPFPWLLNIIAAE